MVPTTNPLVTEGLNTQGQRPSPDLFSSFNALYDPIRLSSDSNGLFSELDHSHYPIERSSEAQSMRLSLSKR